MWGGGSGAEVGNVTEQEIPGSGRSVWPVACVFKVGKGHGLVQFPSGRTGVWEAVLAWWHNASTAGRQ